MATRGTIVLTGDKELNKKLAKLTGTQAKKAIRKGTRPALKVVQKEAKRLAPKDTGTLRKSIKIRSLKRSRTRVGARITTGTETTDFSGKAYYGAFLEYGTKKHTAIEYMKQAADGKRDEAVRIYRNEIAKAIIDIATSGTK